MSDWDAFPTAQTAWDAFPAASAPSVAADVAKSGGIGLVKGAIGMAGAPADTNTLNKTIGGYVGDKLGISPETQSKIGQGYDFAAKSGLLGPGASIGTVAPGSQAIRSGLEKVTGPLYEPETKLGEYAQTAGEFVPAVLGGEGSLAGRLVKQALVPAMASETAGQATKGTAVEPYARIAGGLVGGAVGPAVERMATSRAASAAAPSIEDVKNAATAGFKSPDVAAVTFKPGTIEDVSNIAASDLRRAKLNDRLAPQTHAILDEMKTPVNGAAHTMEDVQTSRQLLGDLAGNFNNPTEQKAASQAIGMLDKLVGSLPQSKLATGDIAKATGAIANARADYASAKTAERVSEKIRNADLQAGSTYSGGNLNNATRQKLRTLLTSKSGARGLTDDELQQIEATVRGSPAGNALRATGKFLGGGGGLGALASGAAGHAVAGPLGLAAPLAGYAVKKAGDAITRANANKIVAQILSRSPTGRAQAAAQPAVPVDRLAMLRRMLLANAATIPLRQSAQPIANGQ